MSDVLKRYSEIQHCCFATEHTGPKGSGNDDNCEVPTTAYLYLAFFTRLRLMGLLQLRYEHDSSTIRARFEHDTTSYEELCAFEQ